MNGWDWRKQHPAGGWTSPSDDRAGEHLFHAYDEEDGCACTPWLHLLASHEDPNEGSSFCPECMEVVVHGRPVSPLGE